MFVAFELQIGLKAEVNGLRVDHLAYEEGQILKAQSLLKDYKYCVLGQRKIDREGRDLIAPKRLCLNNKRLNILADQNKIVILDGPFELDPSWRYSVDLMSLNMA
eukprot:142289-Ditylum_brightwellii.AAC.1